MINDRGSSDVLPEMAYGAADIHPRAGGRSDLKIHANSNSKASSTPLFG